MSSTAGYGKKNQHSIPIDILDDLCSRFIINLPPEDRGNLVRICFQIELAHWFYLDYYCTDETTRLNPCGIREFAAHIFQHVPQLREHVSSLDEVLDNWREYKHTVPTYGAILLDTDLTHVLLVQSYWTKASWGFPKGKVNEDEEPWKCAAREVLEETGFDISNLINKNDYIEATIHEQICRLYIIDDIPRETKFQPRTRNEIRACEWFPLADLPVNKKDMTPKLKLGVSPKAFFMVLPFVKRMWRWVAERNSKVFTNTRRTRHKSMGDVESTSTTKAKAISQGLQNEIQEYQQLNCNPVAKPYKNSTTNSHGNAHNNMQGNVHVNNQGIGNIQAKSQGLANILTKNQGIANIQANSQGFDNIHANNHIMAYIQANNQGYIHTNNQGITNIRGISLGFPNIQANNQGIANIQANNQGIANIHTYNQGIANIHATNQGITNIRGNSLGFANIQANNQGTVNIQANNQGIANIHTNNHGIANIQAYKQGVANIYANTHGSSSSNSHSTSNSHGNSNSSAKNIPNPSGSKKETNDAKRQLYTPQNIQPDPNNSFSPVQKEASPMKESPDNDVFFNFVAPSWADFKFDRRAILDCFT